MLTGRRAFPGDNLGATIHRIVQASPVPPRRIVPTLPSSIEEVVRRCLEKIPQRRFQTAEELREALKSAVSSSRLDAKNRVKFSADRESPGNRTGLHKRDMHDSMSRSPLERTD